MRRPLVQVEPIEAKADARGSLYKLWPGPVSGEVYAVELDKGVSRGHHLHRRGGEWFMALTGRAILVVVDPESGEREVRTLDGVRVRVEPGLAHALFGVEPALVLALADLRPEQDETAPWRVEAP